MKEAFKRSFRQDLDAFEHLAASLLRNPLLTILVIAALIGGGYMVRQHSMKNHLPNAGGCDATEIALERQFSMIRSLKAEIATDLPPEKSVGLVSVEFNLIKSALANLDEHEECGGEVDEARADLEEESRVANAARLAAVAKARAALK